MWFQCLTVEFFLKDDDLNNQNKELTLLETVLEKEIQKLSQADDVI